MKPEVSIIIVNFNTRKLTLDCIDSIKKNAPDLKCEIIVVDNASTDDSLPHLTKLDHKGEIKLIKNDINLGFSKANNMGIKRAKGEHIMLLNSDTNLKKGSLEKLLEFAREASNAGAVAPKLINKDGSTQPSVFHFPSIFGAIKKYWFGDKQAFGEYYPVFKKPVRVDVAIMAAFLITPRAIREVGLLDERYFMYFEDIDYCRRIKKAGLSVYYLPHAEIVHFGGASGMKLEDKQNQWRRQIKSSRIYHGVFKHKILTLVLLFGQKWQKIFHSKNI